MRKPLNNPMPPQSSGIAKLLEQKSMVEEADGSVNRYKKVIVGED
jgi:hypothetical protein